MKFRDPLPNNSAWLEVATARERAAYAEADRRAREARDRMLGAAAPTSLDQWTKSILSDTRPSSVRSETPRPRRGRPQAFSAGHYEHLLERIRELRRNNPFITLQEIADHIGVSQRTLRRTLRRISAQTGEEIGQ